MAVVSLTGIVVIILFLLLAVVVIAGLSFLGYFLYKKNEEKKENRYEE